MNNVRRKELRKAIALIDEARELLEVVAEEEQESFDNLPEGIQTSERGEQMEEYIYTITNFIEALDTEELSEIAN